MTGLDCIAALKALGEETRLRILRLLFKEPMSVNEIADRLRASQYNVSKHLRIMREAGLLEVEKQGKERLYSVTRKLKSQVAANNNVRGSVTTLFNIGFLRVCGPCNRRKPLLVRYKNRARLSPVRDRRCRCLCCRRMECALRRRSSAS